MTADTILSYAVHYCYIPLPASIHYTTDELERECELPLEVLAYTAADALVQAELMFKYEVRRPTNLKFNDLGRDYVIVKIEPSRCYMDSYMRPYVIHRSSEARRKPPLPESMHGAADQYPGTDDPFADDLKGLDDADLGGPHFTRIPKPTKD
jgi:hypothetical protein